MEVVTGKEKKIKIGWREKEKAIILIKVKSKRGKEKEIIIEKKASTRKKVKTPKIKIRLHKQKPTSR